MSSRDRLAERFERLAAHGADRLMGYVLRRVPAEDAPDVAAQTLLVAWRRARVMPEDDDEAIWWLLAIARRTVANHRRGAVRRRALADRLRSLSLAPVAQAETDPDGRVAAAVERLSDDDQELVRLVYWDGLSAKEAATVLGIGDAAARKRLQRARETVRSVLVVREQMAANSSPRRTRR